MSNKDEHARNGTNDMGCDSHDCNRECVPSSRLLLGTGIQKEEVDMFKLFKRLSEKEFCDCDSDELKPFDLEFNMDIMCEIGEKVGFVEMFNDMLKIFDKKFLEEMFRDLYKYYDQDYLKNK